MDNSNPENPQQPPYTPDSYASPPGGDISPQSSPPPAPSYPPPPKRSSRGRRILLGIGGAILLLSIILNFYLVALVAVAIDGGLNKVTIRKGDHNQIIAIYRIDGTIDSRVAHRFDGFCEQVKDNKSVKAVVLRVESPGGSAEAAGIQ